jgi:GNAT superfamily N-acetyltransferase
MVELKEQELYQEISLLVDGKQIGEAEIELTDHMLARLVIYEPYQNQGFGTEILKQLKEKYQINKLWVKTDNERAIHVYENQGFQIKNPTMYLMETNN